MRAIKSIPLFLKVYLGYTAIVIPALFFPDVYSLIDVISRDSAWFLVALWPYVTIILPAYFLKLRGVTPWIYGPVALAGIVGMVELPSVYANHAAERLEVELRSEDFVKPVEGAIKNISFLRRFNDRDRRNIEYMERRVACDPLCQRLLMLGHVESVSVLIYSSDEQASPGDVHDPPFVIRYMLEDRAGGCPRFDGEPDGGLVVLEMTKRAVLEGTCIVGKLIEQSPDGIIFQESQRENRYGQGFFVNWRETETISAMQKNGDETRQVFLRNLHLVETATVPAILGVDINARPHFALWSLLNPEDIYKVPFKPSGQIGF